MSIDDRPLPNKISLYTSDPLPDTIYITSEKYCSTLTSPCNSPPIHFPTSETPTTDHIMIKCGYDYEKSKRGYCARRHDGIRCYKKLGSITPRGLFIRGFITAIDLSERIRIWGLSLLNTNIVWSFVKFIGVFDSLLSITLHVEIMFLLVLFLFSWYDSVQIFLYCLLETFTLSCCYCICECKWLHPCYTAILFWLSSCL